MRCRDPDGLYANRNGRSGGGQGAKPAKGGSEQGRPAPGALEAEEHAPAAASHAAGDVEESMAERLGFPGARLAVQAEALEEGEQVLGGEHELQPDLVGSELAEGEAAQPGVLAAADAVLGASAAAMAGLELGQVGVVLVGDEDLEAEALVIGEGELSAGMGSFAAADGAGSLGPGRQVEVGQLADGGALARWNRRCREPLLDSRAARF